MKKGKRILSLLLMITIVFSLVSCEKKSKRTKGRYVEEEINVPEDVAYAMDFRKCNDGTFVLVGTSLENKLLYYESKDINEDWEKTEIALPTKDNCTTQVNVSKISKDKEIFISYGFYNEDEMNKSSDEIEDSSDQSINMSENKYAIIDTNKNIKDLQLDYLNERDEEGYLEYCNFLFEENIIAMSKENKVLVINKDNGKIENDFNVKGQYISNGAIVDDSLVVVTDSTVKKYDLETGKDLGNIKTLKDKNLSNEIVYMGQGKNKSTLQYITEEGLYKYDEKKDKVSKIIDSSLCSISDSSRTLMALIEVEKNQYVGFYSTYSDTGNIAASLVKYRYDKTKKDAPKEITIYGLYSTAMVENSIARYKKNHPELNIKFKIGMDSEKATVSDAIKTLNTEIVAGKGPDILILDGLPVDEYIEEDLLEDISDIIDGYSDDGEIIESIKDSYTNKDKIYQFPMYFKIPMIVGEKDAIKDVNDVSSLVASVEKVDKNTRIMDRGSAINMITLLQEIQEDKLIDKNGINEEKLKEYFENSKKVYDICKVADNGDEDIEESIDEYYLEILLSRYFNITNYLIADSNKLDINLLTGVDSFANVYSLQDIKEDISYKFLDGNNVFLPNTIIGINSNSKNKDEAKKITKALFSQQCQSEALGQIVGFPTNRLLLEKLKAESKDGHEEYWDLGSEEVQYKIKWPSKEEFEILDKKIKNLDKPIEVNRKLLISLVEVNYKYCNDEISLDEAVKDVIDNTDLDLAE